MHCMWKCESWTLNTSKGSLLVRSGGGQWSQQKSEQRKLCTCWRHGGFFALTLSACFFHTISYQLSPDWTRRWPISFSDPHSPVASWVRDRGIKKVFDRHHGDNTEAQRGGRVGRRRPSGEDYTQYLQLEDQRWWIWFLIWTWRHSSQKKKIESGRNSSKIITQKTIYLSLGISWLIYLVHEKDQSECFFFSCFVFYNVVKTFYDLHLNLHISEPTQ